MSAAAQCCRGSTGSPSHGAGAPEATAPCSDCGNRHYADGYCTACGQRRAEPDRDEADLRGVALITDRGLEHARNEDAAAAGAVW